MRAQSHRLTRTRFCADQCVETCVQTCVYVVFVIFLIVVENCKPIVIDLRVKR